MMNRFFLQRARRLEYAALAIFAAVAGVGLALGQGIDALLAGFAVAALSYSLLVATSLQACPESDLPAIAARHDQRAPYILALGLMIDFASLALVVYVITSRRMDPGAVVLAGAAIFAAWVLLNMLFAIHYAHRFYAPGAECLIKFPDEAPRVFSDFVYFAFIIGMTFQVSDVAIMDSGVRRLALAHSIIAFLFNVFVVALAVNALGSVI